MKIRILRSARRDIVEGFRFYENQSPGIGSYFVDSLFSDIESLLITAGVHRVKYGYHCMLSRRFPFAVYYRVANQIIVVHAIVDCRRNPAWIRKRLKNAE